MSSTSRTEGHPCSRLRDFHFCWVVPKKYPVKKYPDDCTSYFWSLRLLLKICLKLITSQNHAEIIFGSFGKTSHTFLPWYTLLLYLLVSHLTVNVKLWTYPAGFSCSVCTSTWEEFSGNIKVQLIKRCDVMSISSEMVNLLLLFSSRAGLVSYSKYHFYQKFSIPFISWANTRAWRSHVFLMTIFHFRNSETSLVCLKRIIT